MPPSPTASCATTASRSASAITWARIDLAPHGEEARSAVSIHEATDGPASFETRFALLRMRIRQQRVGRPKMNEGAFLYILRCADGSFYIGTTRTALEMRIAQHNAGTFGGYTAARLPVTLVFSQWFDRITDAM